MLPPGKTGRQILNYVLSLSIRSSTVCSVVCYQTCEHDILNTNGLILMPIGTSGLQGKGMTHSTFGSGEQRSRSLEAEIGHKNIFWRDMSRTLR